MLNASKLFQGSFFSPKSMLMKSWLSQMLVDIFVSQNSVFKFKRVCMGGTQGGVCICGLPRERHFAKKTHRIKPRSPEFLHFSGINKSASCKGPSFS